MKKSKIQYCLVSKTKNRDGQHLETLDLRNRHRQHSHHQSNLSHITHQVTEEVTGMMM